MIISLSLSYSDLQCLAMFTEYVINVQEHALKGVTDLKPQAHAYQSEMIKLRTKLNTKLFAWPVTHRRKSIRKFNVSYMQGYILWQHYGHQNQFIRINDKIEMILKHLTY